MKRLAQGKELGPRAKQVVEYVFANPSTSQKLIAKHFGLSEGRVSQIMKSDRVLAAFPLLAKRRIKSMVPKAVERLGELMSQTENLEVSRKVVERVLDTEKVLESQPTTQINVFASLSTQDLARKLEEIREAPSNIVDSEVVDLPDVP